MICPSETKCASPKTLCTQASPEPFCLDSQANTCLSTRINDYVTTRFSKRCLLFLWDMKVCTSPGCSESAILLSIFNIQENHLKSWSYSQCPVCKCSLLHYRENLQHQTQTFATLEQKAKNIGSSLCKEQKSLHTILLNPLKNLCKIPTCHFSWFWIKTERYVFCFSLNNFSSESYFFMFLARTVPTS